MEILVFRVATFFCNFSPREFQTFIILFGKVCCTVEPLLSKWLKGPENCQYCMCLHVYTPNTILEIIRLT